VNAVIHMDEITLQVLKEPDKSLQSKSYLCIMVTRGIIKPLMIMALNG